MSRKGKRRVHGTVAVKHEEVHSNPMNVSMYRQRIAEKARSAPEMCFVSLNHHMDGYWLQVAYRMIRKNGAPGIDQETVETYGANLVSNLRNLEERVRSGRYKAPPVRRVHIPKGSGKSTRPIGIPTVEDKLLQRAVVMLLEPIYEQDFLESSYGFRAGRSAQQALQSLWDQSMRQGTRWILDVDIRAFFDTLDHAHLRSFLDRRVKDGVVRRLINKWLKAGVLEEEQLHYPKEGTPQGGVISPLLSNIYLHYVLDEWFEVDVKPRLKGSTFLLRYADDFVMGFRHREDAERVLEVLPKRFGKYGLSLHPEKTRLVPFGPPPPGRGGPPDRPGTFDFLGLTHYWGRSRKGNWVVKRKTAGNRIRRTLSRIGEWCRANRHKSIAFQQQHLSQMYLGHQAYYGITGNMRWLQRVREGILIHWRRWLNRRTRQQGTMPWHRFREVIKNLGFPKARVVHSFLAAKP